jgi:hypothetical protein
MVIRNYQMEEYLTPYPWDALDHIAFVDDFCMIFSFVT